MAVILGAGSRRRRRSRGGDGGGDDGGDDGGDGGERPPRIGTEQRRAPGPNSGDHAASGAALAPDRARAAARPLVATRRKSRPPGTAKPDEELEDCPARYRFPRAHRPRIRSAKGLERLNQERKRRPRVVPIFPPRAALLRPVAAPVTEQSEEWVGWRDLDPARPEGTR